MDNGLDNSYILVIIIAKTKTITSIFLNFGYKMEVNFAQSGFVKIFVSVCVYFILSLFQVFRF